MRQLIKNNIKYLIFLSVFGLIGGYFTAVYSVQSVSQDVLDEAIAQVGSLDVLILITALQSLGYALILGVLGKILAKKIGLWRKVTFVKEGNIELIIRTEKGIRNGCKPIVICFCALNEGRDLTFQGFLDPIGKELFCVVGSVSSSIE